MTGISIKCDGTPSGFVATTADGSPIFGIRNALITVAAGRPVLAELEIVTVNLDIDDISAKFTAKHPVTGKLQRVKRVEFEDGSVWTDEG